MNCEFSPSFVWSAVNKSLEDDRLAVVDANNEKVRIKGCARVVLYNKGSEQYVKSNQSGQGFLFVDAGHPNFSTPELVDKVKERIDKINQGYCVPCIVLISLVNVTASQEEQAYLRSIDQGASLEQVKRLEAQIQDYKLALSQQLTLLLQYKTPITARHLILVRLVEKKEELTKCHGKKYTRYPRRLVSIWEQVLYDHFREARVIQGALEEEGSDHQNKMLMSGKESGVWVWMCEEIIRRLEKRERCEGLQGEEEKEECFKLLVNQTTAMVDMGSREQCKMYRARS